MEAFGFFSSDDGEETDVLQYEDDSSEHSDEAMRSAASVEEMVDGTRSDDEIMEHAREATTVEDEIEIDYINDSVSTHDSDSSLEYEAGYTNEDILEVSRDFRNSRPTYNSTGFFDTEEEAERNVHRLNEFVYTYKTRYVSAFRVGKEYRCRSHKASLHSIKLIVHQAGGPGMRYQVLQKGQHNGAVVNLKTHGISPVLKPEIDALLSLGMAAGRIRNMMLFKYLRDPTMLALIKQENGEPQ